MIEIRDLYKKFDHDVVAVDRISLDIKEGQVFGLLGTNGAGKSTLLRLIAGILKPEAGNVLIDGLPVWENPEVKREFFYISDEQYFFPNSTPADLAGFLEHHYPDFDREEFYTLLKHFNLDRMRKISTYSKGMKKQLILFAALAAKTKYILCDETFDGLDPVVRHAVKRLIADSMSSRGLTPIIASHNLRELEDICDCIGLLYQGGLLLSRELVEVMDHIHKVQAVFATGLDCTALKLPVISCQTSGHLYTLIMEGTKEQVEADVMTQKPIFMEMLPLTLEELFISETEVAGYDFHTLGI